MLLMKHVRVTLKVFGSPRITQNDPYRGEKEGQWRRLGGTRPPHQEAARPPPRPPQGRRRRPWEGGKNTKKW